MSFRTATGRVLAACVLCVACGSSSAPNPFVEPDGPDAGSTESGAPRVPLDGAVLPPTILDASADADPTLGGPCVDDTQCDDGVGCTFDSCDPLVSRCRFVPDDSQCGDDVFCNGVEICDAQLGCRLGAPVSCSDNDVCTVDRCDEDTRDCTHEPRDADGDGDADENCEGGADCDERDPNVSSQLPEVCGNAIDDDCDGDEDEEECVSPQHDTCTDPLVVDAPGTFSLSPVAAALDVSATCVPGGSRWKDLVVAVTVPDGPNVDIDATVTSRTGTLALATATLCGDASTEAACELGARTPARTSVARLRWRDIAPGSYPLYVFTDANEDLTLAVDFPSPAPEPQNETCGTSATIALETNVETTLLSATSDLVSECAGAYGDLVFDFTLYETRDVRVFASSLDGFGHPTISLRDEGCSGLSNEITCHSSDNVEVFWRALPAGKYHVVLLGTAPTDVRVLVTTSAPTTAPPDESCEDPPSIPHNQTRQIDLTDHIDDIKLGCLAGAVDAAYRLDLETASDVLLIQRVSEGDTGGPALVDPSCGANGPPLSCNVDDVSPVRTAAHDVAAGEYRVVAESTFGTSSALTALVRPATPPTLVAFANDCDGAIDLPSTGGFFQGNTANAGSTYEASCDIGGGDAGGAPDQILRLVLDEEKRVVLDMRGSGYTTLLDVRRGPECPGAEVPGGCSAGFFGDRSFLDLRLEPGEYFIQVDGYSGAEGPWFLDAYIVDP